MEDAAGAVKAAIQNALVPPDASSGAIADVANQISNLSTIMEEDAGRVSGAVSQMIRTGMVKSAKEGFDVLQKGVELGVNKSEDLLDTFNEYGTQFRKFGFDAKTATGLLANGLKAGARDSDTVADSLKELALRIADGTVASAGGFKMIGMNSSDAMARFAKGGDSAKKVFGEMMQGLNKIKDPAKKNAAALALFGTKAEDMGDAIYALDLGKAATSMDDLAGASDRAGNKLEQSAGAKLESFQRKAQAALVDQLAKAVPYLEAMATWVSKNSDVVTILAYALGAFAIAMGIAAVAQWVMNSALLASPITWIIVGILLIVAVIVYLATKTKFFQTIWAGVWGFMKAVGAWFAGPFADFFVNMWNKIVASLIRAKNQFMTAVNFIKSLVMGWVNLQIAAVNKVIGGLGRFVGYVKSVPGKIRGALSSMWEGMKSGFRSAINWVIGKWNSLHFTLPSFEILGKSFGGGTIGVPGIPRLADGGITNGPTLAMIGEGGEREVVAPLSKLPDIAQSQGDRPIVVQVVPGGETEFRRWISRSIRVKGALPSGS
jgi:phage-related minor tail protein